MEENVIGAFLPAARSERTGEMERRREIRRLTISIPPERDGETVDLLLRRDLGLSGTVIRRIKWLDDGILLNGVRVFTSRRVEKGQVLSVRLSDPTIKSGIAPVPGPLEIVYEDGDMLVVNKAPGVLVHPGPGREENTIGNFLMDYYKKMGDAADFHPVHRLDKGTSGLLVVAKHPHAQEGLKRQLHTLDFRRIYLAVCLGAPPEPSGVVEQPIGMVEGSALVRAVRADGRPARTDYRVLSQAGGRALLRLELTTGRTHQIRVHMAHLGCPLAGDFLYGVEDHALLSRPALHSWRLEVTQPVTGARLRLSSPLPADMARLLSEEGSGA